MAYEQFVEDIELIAGVDTYQRMEHELNVYHPYAVYDEGALDFLAVKWTSGGTCWGDVAYPIQPEDPLDISVILALYLEKHIPNISFLEYNKLQKLCITSTKTTESEYYGNWYEYNLVNS